MTYRKQLEKALNQQQWEISSIHESEHWWLDEYWKLESKYAIPSFIYLCFMVDPHFEGGKKSKAINEIKAVSQIPKTWNDDSFTFGKLNMYKGKFDEKLEEFIQQINNYLL